MSDPEHTLVGTSDAADAARIHAGRSTAPILEVVDVRKQFDSLVALSGASFAVERGSITALIGPNGAGKSTMINVISGLLQAESGSIRLEGNEIGKLAPFEIVRRGLVRTFQLARGLPRLTVLENLMLYAPRQSGEQLLAALMRSSKASLREQELREKAVRIAERLKLTRLLDSLASDLSGGQKKLLEIGRVLMSEPMLILMDEPMAGVNPGLALELSEQLMRLRDDGITLLIVEHNMDLVARVSDRVIVMAEGRYLAAGTFEEVSRNSRVQEAYMGTPA